MIEKQKPGEERGRRRRRRMTQFKMNEISAVDNPAQPLAVAAIMKRRGEPGYDPTNPDPKKRGRHDPDPVDKVLPSPRSGESQNDFVARFMRSEDARSEFRTQRQRLAVALGRFRARKSNEPMFKQALLTTEEDGHSHLTIIDREMGDGASPAGMTEPALSPGADFPHQHPWIMDENGNVIIGMAAGHGHEEGEISVTGEEAQRLVMNKAVNPGGGASQEENSMTEANSAAEKDHAAKINESEKRAERAEKRAERLEAALSLGQESREYFVTLDDVAKDAFLAKSDPEQKAEILEAAAADEVIKVDGRTIKKSAVGHDVFETFKALDGQIQKQAEEAKKERELRKKEEEKNYHKELVGRATENFRHLPGSVDAHVALLKFADGIEDSELKKQVESALKAHNAALAPAFKVIGGSAVPADEDHADNTATAQREMDKRAKDIQKANPKIDYYEAYSKAAEADPELAQRAVG